MSPLRMIYLALALLGAVWPMWHSLAWLAANDWSLGGMIDAWSANRATQALAIDLGIAATALTIWACAETMVRRNWLALVAIPVTFAVGLGAGLPLYLYLRTRPIR